jgi:hypothetical protein
VATVDLPKLTDAVRTVHALFCFTSCKAAANRWAVGLCFCSRSCPQGASTCKATAARVVWHREHPERRAALFIGVTTLELDITDQRRWHFGDHHDQTLNPTSPAT